MSKNILQDISNVLGIEIKTKDSVYIPNTMIYRIRNYVVNYYSYDYGIDMRCHVIRFFNLDTMEYAYCYKMKVKKHG